MVRRGTRTPELPVRRRISRTTGNHSNRHPTKSAKITNRFRLASDGFVPSSQTITRTFLSEKNRYQHDGLPTTMLAYLSGRARPLTLESCHAQVGVIVALEQCLTRVPSLSALPNNQDQYVRELRRSFGTGTLKNESLDCENRPPSRYWRCAGHKATAGRPFARLNAYQGSKDFRQKRFTNMWMVITSISERKARLPNVKRKP